MGLQDDQYRWRRPKTRLFGGDTVNTNTDGYFTTLLSRIYSGRSLPRAIAYLAIYALTIGLASLLWPRPVTLTLTYGLLSALLLWRWHAFSDLLYFALPAILGPMGEFVAVGFGAWEYSLPLLNIPVWLPLAWGISGLCLKKIADLLMEAQAG
jgi:hypothetical protein